MLTNAFQTGYNQGDLIQFTISGISNPSTVGSTEPITIKIYYIEFQSDINIYDGSNMTL